MQTVKVLGVIIGLLMLVGVCSNLTSSDEAQPVSKAQPAPAIVSTPTPTPPIPPLAVPAPPPPEAPAVQAAAPKPAAPAVAPKPPTPPKQPALKAPAAPAPKPAAKSYANCTEVKAAGTAPLYRGQPGYSSSLDRDGDGIACEK